VTFRVKADDEMRGFSERELAVKVMKYFNMMYQINLHYNMDLGKFQEEELPLQKWVFDCLFEYEYYDNGVVGLEYQKDGEWEVIFLDYL